MAGRLLAARFVEGEFHSAGRDSGLAGVDPLSGERGAGAERGGQSDSESDREWQDQARSGGQRRFGREWAGDPGGVGPRGNRPGKAGGSGPTPTERETAGVATRAAGALDGEPAVRARGIAEALGR